MKFGKMFNAMVSRQVGRKEMMEDPEARAFMRNEWLGQHKQGVYDFTVVREYDDVFREANKNGTEVHMSCSWNLCREDYQLPKGSPGRKFKGRGVLLGNQVKKQHWELRSSRTWATLLRGVKMGRFLWMCPWEWGEVRVMCPAHLFETPHDRSA
jgi:hypothetical protein